MATKINCVTRAGSLPRPIISSGIPKFRGVQFAPRGLVVHVPKPFQREFTRIHMNTKTVFMSAWTVLAAILVACTLLAYQSAGVVFPP